MFRGAVFGVLVLLQIWSALLLAVAEQEPVSEALSQRGDESTTLYSADGFLKCVSDLHITPTSSEEISSLIKLHGDKPVRIRASRRGFHSTAGFVCPGARGSTKLEEDATEMITDEGSRVTSITVLMHRMNHVVSVDAEQRQITVEAGMTQYDLAEAAEANNMSVLAGAFSIYGSLTLGGIISTSAHGSGLGTTCSLGDLVTKVKWVNASGEIIVSEGDEVKALVGGLGLLGIITEFTFQLHPPSRTVVESRIDLDDTNIVKELTAMLKQETPHVISFWRPDIGKYRANLFTHVGSEEKLPASAPPFDPEARTVFMGSVDDRIASSWSDMMAAWGNDSAMDPDSAASLNAGACSAAAATVTTIPFLTDGNGSPVHHATLPTHRAMLAAECSPKCSHQHAHMGGVSEDTELTIKFSRFEEWVQDVRAIVKTELDALLRGKIKKSCLPPGAFWLRFGKGTDTLLSTNTGTEDVVFLQWTMMTSARTPRIPGKQATMSDTVEQLSLCKYGARPHWGKNHERLFRHPTCHLRESYPSGNIDRMVALQDQHDPKRIFEPELFRHVIWKSGNDYSELCALQMWCYCDADEHCALGHSCQPSPVFPEYNICRLNPNPNSVLTSSNQHDEL